jgi:hypothetical protein
MGGCGHHGISRGARLAGYCSDAVTDWHEIATNTLCTATVPTRGPSAIIDLAIVQAAVHDAVQAIGGKYKPYQVQIPGASGSPEAAAAKASHDALVSLFPTQAAALGTTYKEYLAKKRVEGRRSGRGSRPEGSGRGLGLPRR